MTRVKLTDELIQEAQQQRKGKEIYLGDSELPGFGARIHRGSFSFYVRFHRDGRWRRESFLQGHVVHIGTVKIAREIAAELLLELHEPPHRAVGAERLDDFPENAGEHMIERVAAEFTTEHLVGLGRSHRYLQDSKSRFLRFVRPAWKGRDVRSITPQEVQALLDGIVASGAPIQANRTLSLLRMFFQWALARGLIQNNPAQQLQNPAQERQRDRVLKDQELAAIWWAADKLSSPWNEWFKALMLTGRRRSECAEMRWDDLNLRDHTWAPSTMRSGRAQFVPLSARMLDVLATIRKRAAPWVFATRHGVSPGNFSDGKRQIERQLAARVECVEPWKIEDLRRSVQDWLKLRVQPDIVDALLGKTLKFVPDEIHLREQRRAIDLWGNHVIAVAESNPGSD